MAELVLVRPQERRQLRMDHRLFTFVGGETGPWRVASVKTITGEPLAGAARLNVTPGSIVQEQIGAKWLPREMTSNERYLTGEEKQLLAAKEPALGRPEATHAALIPIRKNASWWNLPQDERRRIFEEQSHHTQTGIKFLPAIARRLHHCRDLGENEPFDFLTWFEYARSDSAAFDELVVELRASEEWAYVDREIDIRVVRDGI